MEFERGLFRVYERMLKAQALPNREIQNDLLVTQKKRTLNGCEKFFGVMTLISFILWFWFHVSFVVDNQVLKPAIEDQLKGMFY